MNELTMREKMMLIGLLGVAYDRKAELIKDKDIEFYADYLQQDMQDIKSISHKLILDMVFEKSSQVS